MGFLSWYNSVNKSFQDSLANIGSGIWNAVTNIGKDPVNAPPGTGSGNPIPEVVEEIKQGDIIGAGSVIVEEVKTETVDFTKDVVDKVTDKGSDVVEWVDTTIVKPSEEVIKDAGEWASEKIVRPTVEFIQDAGEWANDNVRSPISKTWDKYKIPILAGAGAVVAIKILK